MRLAMAARPAVESQGAELTTFGGRAVSRWRLQQGARTRVKGVELVPLATDGRALIALSEGTTKADFELGVRDLLESGSLGDADKRTLKSLLTFVADARRQGGLTLRKILVLHSRRGSRKAAKSPRR